MKNLLIIKKQIEESIRINSESGTNKGSYYRGIVYGFEVSLLLVNLQIEKLKKK